MKYDEKFIQNLARENNTSIRGLSRLLGLGTQRLYRYLQGRLEYSKRGAASAHVIESKIDGFLLKKADNNASSSVISRSSRKTNEKVFLNTIAEIVEALRDGFALYSSERKGCVKMIEGHICSCLNDIEVAVNVPLLVSDQYYIWKSISIHPEVGKQYVSRNKERVLCYCCENDTFRVCVIGKNYLYEVDKEGKSVYETPGLDLVEEVDD